jgi:hypothetical protein
MDQFDRIACRAFCIHATSAHCATLNERDRRFPLGLGRSRAASPLQKPWRSPKSQAEADMKKLQFLTQERRGSTSL